MFVTYIKTYTLEKIIIYPCIKITYYLQAPGDESIYFL